MGNSIRKPKCPYKIKPGQIWLDDAGIWDCYDGEMAYVVKSKEWNEPWVLIKFQDWDLGGYKRYMDKKEIRKMKYIGHISELNA
jgi:hypothetical protein